MIFPKSWSKNETAKPMMVPSPSWPPHGADGGERRRRCCLSDADKHEGPGRTSSVKQLPSPGQKLCVHPATGVATKRLTTSLRRT